MGDQQTILSVKALNVSFPKNGERVQVLRNVSFDIKRGETVAVVGESGSGKSITALSIMGLQPQGARVSGNILFGNEFSNLVTNKSTEWQNLRGKDIGMVFQEPMSSLNSSSCSQTRLLVV